MAHPDIFVPRRRRGVQLDDDQLVHYQQEPVAGIVNSTLLTDPDAPGRMQAASPEVRLVAILRNPVDRAYSWYLKRLRDGDGIYANEMRFEEALERDPALIAGGLYYDGLVPYIDQFGRDQILLVDYAQLADDPASFIGRIYDFVGADGSFQPPQLDTRSNYSAAVRSSILHQAMRRGKRVLWRVSGENGPLMSRFESSALVGRLRRLNEQGTTTMAPGTRQQLADRFAAPNQLLADLVDWDVGDWR